MIIRCEIFNVWKRNCVYLSWLLKYSYIIVCIYVWTHFYEFHCTEILYFSLFIQLYINFLFYLTNAFCLKILPLHILHFSIALVKEVDQAIHETAVNGEAEQSPRTNDHKSKWWSVSWWMKYDLQMRLSRFVKQMPLSGKFPRRCFIARTE